MVDRRTRVDRWIDAIKNHQWLAGLIVAGVVLIAVGGAVDAGSRLLSYLRPAARLEIVAADELQPGVLDLTLRNPTYNDAVITAIEGEVVALADACSSVLGPSARYTLRVGPELGAKGVTKVRHVIPAHGADRFTISPWRACQSVRIKLRYNRDRTLVVPGT